MRRVALALALASVTGCADDAPVAIAQETAVSEAPAEVPAVTAEVEDPPPAGTPRHASLEELQRELGKQCAPAKDPMTTVEMHEAMGHTLGCLRDLLATELARPGAARVRDEQKAYAAHAEALCNLDEESRWIDLEARWRSDGTLRSFRYAACIESSLTRRIFQTRAVLAGDARGLVAALDAGATHGAFVRAEVRRIGGVAQQQLIIGERPTEPDSVMGSHLGVRELGALSHAAAGVETSAAALAGSTCAAWPELATAAGGQASCRSKAAAHYLAFASFESDGG